MCGGRPLSGFEFLSVRQLSLLPINQLLKPRVGRLFTLLLTYLRPLTNRVPCLANDTPGTLVNHWTSTKGAKGTIVVVLVASGF